MQRGGFELLREDVHNTVLGVGLLAGANALGVGEIGSHPSPGAGGSSQGHQERDG